MRALVGMSRNSLIMYSAVFNLAEGIDVEQTEAKLAEYERTNREAIAINAAKKASTMRHAVVLLQTSWSANL